MALPYHPAVDDLLPRANANQPDAEEPLRGVLQGLCEWRPELLAQLAVSRDFPTNARIRSEAFYRWASWALRRVTATVNAHAADLCMRAADRLSCPANDARWQAASDDAGAVLATLETQLEKGNADQAPSFFAAQAACHAIDAAWSASRVSAVSGGAAPAQAAALQARISAQSLVEAIAACLFFAEVDPRAEFLGEGPHLDEMCAAMRRYLRSTDFDAPY